MIRERKFLLLTFNLHHHLSLSFYETISHFLITFVEGENEKNLNKYQQQAGFNFFMDGEEKNRRINKV